MRLHMTLLLCGLFASCSSSEDPAPSITPAPDTAAPDTAAPDTAAADDVATGSDTSVTTETTEPPVSSLRATVISDPADLIGGEKADGRAGDVLMRNDHVAFVIEGARRASGYRYQGGHVVDAALVAEDGSMGQDHFGEIIPTWNLRILYPDNVTVVSDGADGEAHVRVTGTTGVFWWAENNSFLSAFTLPQPDLNITYDYRLAADDRELRLTRTLHNPGDEDVLLDFNVVIANHGDGIYPWTPGSGFGAIGASPYLGVSGRDTAYAAVAVDGGFSPVYDYSSITIYLQDPVELPAGGDASSDWRYAVTDRGPAGLDAAARRVTDQPAGRVTGTVELPATAPAETAWVVVWDADEPVTLTPVGHDGSFDVSVTPGQSYEPTTGASTSASRPASAPSGSVLPSSKMGS